MHRSNGEDARPCLQLFNLGLWAGNQHTEYVFLLLINERDNFGEEEAAGCGGLRLSVCSAKVVLLRAGKLWQR